MKVTSVYLIRGLIYFFIAFQAYSNANAKESIYEIQKDSKHSKVNEDSLFSRPYIDIDEWRDVPVRHRYVHGGFEGTETRFSFYFPPKEQYQGRFFQYITPVPDNENLSQGAAGEEDKIGFSISSGAYFIETNGGGNLGWGGDPTIGAYRANAAAAQYSRTIAMEMFGVNRPYGYAFGGSGGAYRTIGGFENTEGVWDGVVPYVLGSPMAIPNVFSVRMHAMRILKDKFPQIIDAVDPGGSGDMYAGLNQEEREALLEVTKMGFPPQSWYAYKDMGVHGFVALYQGVAMADRSYFENDFWNVEGYLGANPTQSLLDARIKQISTIKKGISVDEAVKIELVEPISDHDRGTADMAWKTVGGAEGAMPVAFELNDMLKNVDFLGGDLIIKSGEGAGKSLQLKGILDNKVILGPVDPNILRQIKPGNEVQVDNSNFLAAQTYHRHQVPGKEYKVWDQFRDEEGNPIYPQRPMLIGPLFTRSTAGSVPNGQFKGKMILLGSLWDREAYAWQSDWYRERVKENLGDSTEQYFRLWYTDHAVHGDQNKQDDPTRVVSYLGVLQQALRDLSAWVEKGAAPPATTNYTIEDGQVVLPQTAEERKGIQPVVELKVNEKDRADIAVGESVTFTAIIEVPENTGKIVSATWDFDGSETFKEIVNLEDAKIENNGRRVELTILHKFTEPGTHFPVLRVASQREGDNKTPFTRIQNLDRVRVVVE